MIYGGKFALTRFANNTIHQNVAEENYSVSVRTRLADALHALPPTNSTATVSSELCRLRRVWPRFSIPIPICCRCRVRASRPRPHNKPGPAGILRRPLRSLLSCARTGSRKLYGCATRHKLTTAGIFSASESVEGIFNSRGLRNWHTQTSAEISITMLAADSSGWQKANSPNVANLDPADAGGNRGRQGGRIGQSTRNSAGKYTVILEPAAVLDITGFMFWDFGGLAILDQRSFLNNRVGSKLFGDNITIWDDVAHPLQSGSPFDGEGMRRQQVQLVEKGVVKRLVYARATAEKMRKSEHARQSRADRSLPATDFLFPTKWARPDEHRFRSAQRSQDCRADDRIDRTRHSGNATVVHPRS